MIRALIRKLKKEVDEFYHTPQIDAFFAWLNEHHSTKDEIVFINLPNQQEVISTQTLKKVRDKDSRPAGFIICQNHQLHASLQILGGGTSTDWHLIFFALEFEIWEYKKRHKQLPLRFGLSDEEKQFLLSFSRECMEKKFKRESIDTNSAMFDDRYAEKATVDVALWINGSLRGSIIVQRKPLQEAIKMASEMALCDVRMKPVEEHELAAARIEISVFSDLALPLLTVDIKSNRIEGRRGYYVSYGRKQGWYLPTVFNCTKFTSTDDLLQSLVKKKAKIKQNIVLNNIKTFLVDSFIEGEHAFLSLDGSVAFVQPHDSKVDEKTLWTHGDRAALWIVSMQDEEGCLPLYIDPFTQRYGKMDWVRMACTIRALAVYGTSRNDRRFKESAEKGLRYLLRYVLGQVPLSADITVGTLVYLSEAALALKCSKEQMLINEHITLHQKNLSFRPIILASLASLFAERAVEGDKAHLDEARAFSEKIFLDFQRTKEKKETEIARYPELAHAQRLLYKATGNSDLLEKARSIEEWLISKQSSNGAFSEKAGNTFQYSRGTAKVFEILAETYPEYKEATDSAFLWLSRLQYSPENLYFAAPVIREKCIGGLRHDYVNTEAWIDGAGHFLLGIARLGTYLGTNSVDNLP